MENVTNSPSGTSFPLFPPSDSEAEMVTNWPGCEGFGDENADRDVEHPATGLLPVTVPVFANDELQSSFMIPELLRVPELLIVPPWLLIVPKLVRVTELLMVPTCWVLGLLLLMVPELEKVPPFVMAPLLVMVPALVNPLSPLLPKELLFIVPPLVTVAPELLVKILLKLRAMVPTLLTVPELVRVPPNMLMVPRFSREPELLNVVPRLFIVPPLFWKTAPGLLLMVPETGPEDELPASFSMVPELKKPAPNSPEELLFIVPKLVMEPWLIITPGWLLLMVAKLLMPL